MSPLPDLADQEFGSDDKKDVIIFMAGFVDDLQSEPFKPQVDKFKSTHKCYVTCLPDLQNDRLNVNFKWGYDFDMCVQMLSNLIDSKTKKNQQVTLVGHGFGAVICHLYVHQHGVKKVSKLVSLDVGWCEDPMLPMIGQGPFKQAILCFPYWILFAITFLLDVCFRHSPLNAVTVVVFAISMAWSIALGPFVNGLSMSDRRSSIMPYMTYPFYYLMRCWVNYWRASHTAGYEENRKTKPMPGCPYLYIWGVSKRVEFHTNHLLANVDAWNKRTKDGSRAFGIPNAGHYVHVDNADKVNEALEVFLIE